MSRCEITDLSEDMCAHCLGMDEFTKQGGFTIVRTIEARHNGSCGHCGEYTIRAGNPLHLAMYEADGSDEWVGDCCAGKAS